VFCRDTRPGFGQSRCLVTQCGASTSDERRSVYLADELVGVEIHTRRRGFVAYCPEISSSRSFPSQRFRPRASICSNCRATIKRSHLDCRAAIERQTLKEVIHPIYSALIEVSERERLGALAALAGIAARRQGTVLAVMARKRG
jgi:hypothetical protein